MVGFAWIGIVQADCTLNYTFTCPDSSSTELTVLFLLNSLLYVTVACAGYHVFIEGVRLRKRATKVEQIQQGDAER